MTIARIIRGTGTSHQAVCDGRAVAVRSTDADVQVGDWVELAPTENPEEFAVAGVVDRPGGLGPTTELSRWSSTAAGKSRGEYLWQRQDVLAALRTWLHSEGMLELAAPALVRGTCPDEWLDSFPVGPGLYLTTSTEYHIKRMLVGGFQRVYTLGPNFRRGDLGTRHNPEFTMLEWGRVGASMRDIERDAESIVELALRVANRHHLAAPDGREVPFVRPFVRLPVREALETYLGVDVDPQFSASSLAAALQFVGIEGGCKHNDDRPFAFTLLLERLSEHLGFEAPTFLVEWPAFQTSSTGSSDNAPVERSELFVGGLEISDGFPFLRSASMQRDASLEHLRKRAAAGLEPVALDQRFLDALKEGMPPGAGMALGIERLLMVALGARSIQEVMAFTWDEL